MLASLRPFGLFSLSLRLSLIISCTDRYSASIISLAWYWLFSVPLLLAMTEFGNSMPSKFKYQILSQVSQMMICLSNKSKEIKVREAELQLCGDLSHPAFSWDSHFTRSSSLLQGSILMQRLSVTVHRVFQASLFCFWEWAGTGILSVLSTRSYSLSALLVVFSTPLASHAFKRPSLEDQQAQSPPL